jgi:hypothetical protein
VLKLFHFLSISFFLISGFALLLSAMPTAWEQAPIKSCEAQKKPPGCERDKTSLVSVVFVRLGGTIEAHRDDINVCATIVIAAFTVILGIFTVNLAGSTRVAADAANKSAITAERALIDAERPYVFVYNVRGFLVDQVDDDVPTWIECSIANYGKNAAIVRRVGGGFFKNALTAPFPLSDVTTTFDLGRNPFLANGAVVVRKYIYPLPWHFTATEESAYDACPILSDDESLFFQIIIEYDGPLTTGHRVVGCWRWKEEDLSFHPDEGQSSQS